MDTQHGLFESMNLICLICLISSYCRSWAQISKPTTSPTAPFHAWTVWLNKTMKNTYIYLGLFPLPSSSGKWRLTLGTRKTQPKLHQEYGHSKILAPQSGDRQGCTPPKYPVMGNPKKKPYIVLGIYELQSPRIPREHNKYHGYNVRGTPSCPLTQPNPTKKHQKHWAPASHRCMFIISLVVKFIMTWGNKIISWTQFLSV